MSVRTSISDISDYRKFCAEAAETDEIFGSFRNHPIYKSIVETVSSEFGAQYATLAINKLPKILDYMDEFRRNDLYGGSQLFRYSNIGVFSPTTLRYIKFAIDMREMFGDLDAMRVAEIGVGYGGQCRILSALFKIKSYDLFDLPEPLLLARRYLDIFGLQNVNFCDIDAGEFGPYDLVISNYAISEVEKSVQDKYIDKVILKSARGFVVCNREFFKYYYPGFSYDPIEFCGKIPGARQSPDWRDEISTNRLIFWSNP
ncbi:MAG: putative sugar O-methyltransferase [Niveispirillum sp.]|uniref:putative sugar O-methyltransferase n=1 Tax=Niveispirillum sp. TaxID=1917217 RepID=UPI003BA44F7E